MRIKIFNLKFLRSKIAFLIIIIIAVSISIAVISNVDTYVATEKYCVVLDAGHGGIDGGVTGSTTGVKESELNLIIVKLIKAELRKYGINVVLTRTTSDGLYGSTGSGFKRRDMQARKKIITTNSPDLVVSIHMNKYSLSSRRGPQVFFQKGQKESQECADFFQDLLNKLSDFQYSALGGDFYILTCTPKPSIIIECGFLSNSQDENLLTNKNYQKKISEKIAEGIIAYMYMNTSAE